MWNNDPAEYSLPGKERVNPQFHATWFHEFLCWNRELMHSMWYECDCHQHSCAERKKISKMFMHKVENDIWNVCAAPKAEFFVHPSRFTLSCKQEMELIPKDLSLLFHVADFYIDFLLDRNKQAIGIHHLAFLTNLGIRKLRIHVFLNLGNGNCRCLYFNYLKRWII